VNSDNRTWMSMMLSTALVACVPLSASCTSDQGAPPSSLPAESPTTVERSGTQALEGEDVCPAVLPQPPGPDGWLGTDEPATAFPALPSFDRAWICSFGMKDLPAPSERRWILHDDVAVDSSRLTELGKLLSGLRPPRYRGCTDDLGPRWLVVVQAAQARIGILIDGFGCNSVRLTDNPLQTPPGEGTSQGTVPGELSTSDDSRRPLLDLISSALDS
jgi:hypothetical protein